MASQIHVRDRMSNLRLTMPFGYTVSDTKITFKELKQLRLRGVEAPLQRISKLTLEQRQDLTIDCWEYGLWNDLIIANCYLTKSEAIKEVKEYTEVGNDLMELTMTGYAHLYKTVIFPHNETRYPLMKHVKPPFSSASTIPRERASHKVHGLVTVYNNLSFTVWVRRFHEDNDIDHRDEFVGIIPAGQEINCYIGILDLTEHNELLVANFKDIDQTLSVVSAYIAYPGCTTWNIATFPTDSFFPSAWKLDDKQWVICITNNLKTYACIWQVMPNGSLNFIHAMSQCSSIKAGPCYIGTSLVATQGSTVISKFFAVDSTAYTTWSIGINIHEKLHETGDNNYIFYQVKTPQDDTVTPTSKLFTTKITIPSGVGFLYASLFDSCNAYFATPEGVTVTIDSQDASGSTTLYNSNTNTESLFIQMTAGEMSLQKLCIKDPAGGTWTINIKAMTNTPVYFQFQTVPTKDTYATMQATLRDLVPNWKEIAYAGFTNIVNTQTFGGKEDLDAVSVIPAVAAIGVVLLNVKEHQWVSLTSDVQNDEGDVKEATNTIVHVVTPTQSNPGILLVDANGTDRTTEVIYNGRQEHLYTRVESGAFRDKHSKLVGQNEAIREIFLAELKKSKFKLVSVAGHGNSDYVNGYRPKAGHLLPILKTSDVDEDLAEGTIFHILACRTAINLGRRLFQNKALAYFGYNENFAAIDVQIPREIHDTATDVHPRRDAIERAKLLIMKPDCTIVNELMKGSTANQAFERARGMYRKIIRSEWIKALPDLKIIGKLEMDRKALTMLGDGTAKLVQVNNQD